MKTFFTTLILFITLFSKAQTYNSFPDSNAVWSIDINKEYYLIKGDSLYNTFTYKKFYTTTDSTLNPLNLYFIGLIREDIPNKKVYGISSYTNTETLMYDFNVNLNDIITVSPLYCVAGGTTNVQIMAIDSVLVNGNYRKRLHVGSYYNQYPEYWIEGIGSSYGPACPGMSSIWIPDVYCPPYLISMTLNGNPYFVNSEPDLCDHVGIKNANVANSNMIIYPNPARSVVNFEIPNSIGIYATGFECIIFDSNGKQLLKQPIKQNHFSLDVSKYSAGLYFIIITDESVVRYKQKLIIE